ncbi:LIPOPROTEIN [Mycoplasmopsis pulmonis]|uniref:LIPOPROTEIN n=1 Tax=Mycoplasmopsis pulmonis (strain UAB CTIP) TaxID=272635 RepID=Q98R17_MYCPU|nr:aromatic motif membrane protein [Mycoplasmopsis pulmonis]CAC13366.1 LIPOPROTEIN [Mycoplasmopsis pulmonis]
MNKKRLLLSIGFLSNLVFLPLLLSCQKQAEIPVKINNQLSLSAQEKEDKNWNSFLNSESINTLLNTAFYNEETKQVDEHEKQNFIEEQKAIDTQKYLQEIRESLFYSNLIQTNSFILSFFGTPIHSVKNSREKIKDLTSKNWLWLLYNFDKFVFIYSLERDLFKHTTEEYDEQVAETNLNIGSLYSPKTNNFIDHASMIYSNTFDKPIPDGDDKSFHRKTTKFFLMNEDGFIFELEINSSYQEDPKTNQFKIERDIRSFPYLKSYPKLLKSTNKKKDFSLSDYIKNTQFFEGYIPNEVDKILFEELHGGEQLRYGIIQTKNKK